MRLAYLAISVIATLLSTCTLAGNESMLFSPYVDLTLNTHWDPNTQAMEPVDLVAVSKASGIKHYHLAFITDAGSCEPAWAAQASFALSKKWGTRLTDALRANHIGYVVGFGGASGNDISKACSEQQLITTLQQIMQIYQPQGLDFDIENGTADVNKIMSALHSVQLSYPSTPISFTLPVLPEGLTAEGRQIVAKAKEKGLNFHVNIMAMDYGPAYTNDMGQYAIQAATSLSTYLKSLYPEKSVDAIWQMIEVTPMIGVNDVNVEQFTLENTDTLRRFAKQNKLASLSMWSVTRDKPCPDKWASPICSGNSLQTKPYEFAERFMRNE